MTRKPDTPIEMMAYAISRQQGFEAQERSDFADWHWEESIDEARAALRALAECELPPSALRSAGGAYDWPSVSMAGASPNGMRKAENIFRAMCSAIAKENEA